MPNPPPFTFIKNLSDQAELKPNSISSQIVYNDDSIRVTLFYFDKGQALSEHKSSKPAILQIVKGQAELGLGDETVQAAEGSWVHMVANLPHSVSAKTSLIMMLTLLKN